MSFGYDYTHSAVDGNGVEYISFMLEPERIDGNGLRYGKAVHIDIDNKRQKTMVYTFDWIRGGPANHEKIVELKDEVVGDVESYADAPSNEACKMAINALRPVSREQVKRCIEIVENQRDSAIKELENYMVQDVLDGNEPCAICAKASDTPCEYCNPKWRGQKEE